MYVNSFTCTNVGWTPIIAPGNICAFALRASDGDVTIASSTTDANQQDTLFKGEQETVQGANAIYASGQTILWVQAANGYTTVHLKLYSVPFNSRQ